MISAQDRSHGVPGCGKTLAVSQPFVVRVHSLASLDESLERGEPVEPRRPVLFGRVTGHVVDASKGLSIRVPMLDRDRTTNNVVSRYAGHVSLDEYGRPWLTNGSETHDLIARKWPHNAPETVARHNRKQLGEGWWWVYTSGTNPCCWLLVSVEATRRRGVGTPRNVSQLTYNLDTDDTLKPEPLPVHRIPDDLFDVFVDYFVDWFSMPPSLSPRVRTSVEAGDVGDNKRNRILTALKVDVRGPTGRRGRWNAALLIRAVDEGKVSFRAVYDRAVEDSI